jgi:hypothetical protein
MFQSRASGFQLLAAPGLGHDSVQYFVLDASSIKKLLSDAEHVSS